MYPFRRIVCLFQVSLILLFAHCGGKPKVEADFSKLGWTEIVHEARGETLRMIMWQGDPLINRYMKEYIEPALKNEYGITLSITGGQGNAIVSMVMNEKEAGKKESDVDICWINGETFYQLRQVDGLYGPFVSQLPNSVYIDFDNPSIKYDFQKPVEGMECPWGNVQLCLIYNSEKVTDPPKNRAALAQFVKAYPGKFTIANDFTGLTFLKSVLIDIAGGPGELKGNFDSLKYCKYSAELWHYINSIKVDFWKQGKTFPSSTAMMHQLFGQGELYITMSNNDGEVDNKVEQGIFPKFARSYVLDAGTIQNSHYLGILKNSPHQAAAMVAINFMISPEAQLEKQKPLVWGDGTVLQTRKLPAGFAEKFDSLQERQYGPRRQAIQGKALMELDPQYMIRMNDDFKKYVIEQ
jgi:putative spermidine/putrescine transport system substrate-binding protein